jgi:hypothetical protein
MSEIILPAGVLLTCPSEASREKLGFVDGLISLEIRDNNAWILPLILVIVATVLNSM